MFRTSLYMLPYKVPKDIIHAIFYLFFIASSRNNYVEMFVWTIRVNTVLNSLSRRLLFVSSLERCIFFETRLWNDAFHPCLSKLNWCTRQFHRIELIRELIVRWGENPRWLPPWMALLKPLLNWSPRNAYRTGLVALLPYIRTWKYDCNMYMYLGIETD